MKAIPIIVAVSFFVIGCEKHAQSTAATSNKEFQVELLFEHDGVKVYRFCDGGSFLYYTDARGSVVWLEQVGKVQTPREIKTVK